MRNAIAVLNVGSSSLKFALFLLRPGRDRLRRDPVPLLRGQIERIGQSPVLHVRGRAGLSFEGPSAEVVAEQARDHTGALALLLDWFEEDRARIRVAAAGHRVVYGGIRFITPQPVTEDLVAELTRLQPLAPQHLPHNLVAIKAMLARRPDLPQAACFDTAFHATQPPLAKRLPLPRQWHDAGVRRMVVANPNTTQSALQVLSFDQDAKIKREARNRLGQILKQQIAEDRER